MLAIEIKSDKGIEELRYAIIKQACVDYDEALKYLRGRNPTTSDKYLRMQAMKTDCEDFFNSEYFSILCDISGKLIMDTIRHKYYNRPIRWGEKGER